MAFLAFGAMAEAMSAGTSSTYGTVGGQPVYLETYDPAKRAIVNQQNQAKMERVAKQNAILNDAVERGLVKRNTLLPGYYVEGNVMAKFVEAAYRLTIIVPFGSETHTFLFERPVR